MKNKQQSLLFLVLVCVSTLIICFRQIIDIDLWWHMELGQAFLESFGKVDLSQFYFSPVSGPVHDLRYTWLGDIILFCFYKVGGEFGLQVLRLILVAVSLYLAWDLSGRKVSPFHSLLMLIFLLASYQIQILRNAIFSLPLFTMLFWLWWKMETTNRWVWGFPIVLTLWSFLHGTFMLGAVVFFLLVFGKTYEFLGSTSREPQVKKGKKKKIKNVPTETSPVEDVLKKRFDQLRLLFVSLLLSFIGSVSFNRAATFQLKQTLGSAWWLFVVFGGILIGIMAFYSRSYEWALKIRKPLFRVVQVGLLLCVLGFIVIMFLRVGLKQDPIYQVDLRDPTLRSQLYTDSVFDRVKVFFNSLVFKGGDQDLVSSDFLSPLDHLDEVYIAMSFILALLFLFSWKFIHRHAFCLIFPFLPVFVLGLGYKRTAGYLGLLSVIGLLRVLGHTPFTRFTSNVWLWPVNIALILYIGSAAMFRPQMAGLWEHHVFGMGRAPYFSSSCAEILRQDYSEEPTFTSLSSGGYLLHKWHPQKKVFVDGFFAPHYGKTFRVYLDVLKQHTPDRLFNEFGIKSAILTHRDLAWISLFSRSRHWYPQYLDQGMIVFRYIPDWDQVGPAEVLFDRQAWGQVPEYFRPMLANRLFEIPASMIARGRVVEAKAYLDKYDELLENAKPYAESFSLEQLDRNLDVAMSRYGGHNSPLLYDEFGLQSALQAGDYPRVVECGNRLWSYSKDIDLGLELARAYLEMDELDRASHLLSEVQSMVLNLDVETERAKMAAFIGNLMQRLIISYEEKGLFFKAIERVHGYSNLSPESLTETIQVQKGLSYFQKLREAQKVDDAYELLLAMRRLYPNSPFVLHNLAVHVSDFHQQLNLNLEMARSFEEQAVALGERQKIERLDILLTTLAGIHRDLGDLSKYDELMERARSWNKSMSEKGER